MKGSNHMNIKIRLGAHLSNWDRFEKNILRSWETGSEALNCKVLYTYTCMYKYYIVVPLGLSSVRCGAVRCAAVRCARRGAVVSFTRSPWIHQDGYTVRRINHSARIAHTLVLSRPNRARAGPPGPRRKPLCFEARFYRGLKCRHCRHRTNKHHWARCKYCTSTGDGTCDICASRAAAAAEAAVVLLLLQLPGPSLHRSS